jgi:hypothetical protein
MSAGGLILSPVVLVYAAVLTTREYANLVFHILLRLLPELLPVYTYRRTSGARARIEEKSLGVLRVSDREFCE